MAAHELELDFELTRDDVDRFTEALKDKEFRKLFSEYCEEIQDPANRAQYQAEITQLEKQRGIDITFINPSPGYVIKTSVGGEKKAFINVCSNDNVEKPTFSMEEQSGKKGINWRIPHTMAPPHDDFDKKKNRCIVYDVVFHSNTLRMGEKNDQFRKMLNDTACDAVESNHSVKLDRKNLKFPKLSYKGVVIPSAVRKRSEDFNEENKSKEDAELLEKLYPQKSFPSKTETVINSNKIEDFNGNVNDTSSYTVPKYLLKQRRDIELSEFTYEKDAKQKCAIPSYLILEVMLPLLSSSADAKLDVKDKTLILISETPARYKLEVQLPYKVDDESGSAKFDLDKRLLIVTLPVISEKMLLSWRNREDSGVESDSNSPCVSDEDNSHSLFTELSNPHKPDSVSVEIDSHSLVSEIPSKVFIENDSYRTNVTKMNQFLNPDLIYTVPPYTCHALDNTLALTLHVKNVESESIVFELLDDNNCIQLKFSSIGAGYYPIYHALFLKFPTGYKCDSPVVEPWDNNVVMQVEIIGVQQLPHHYFIGLHDSSLEEKKLHTSVESILPKINSVESDKILQPTVEVSAKGNNEVNISLRVAAEEDEVVKYVGPVDKRDEKLIHIPKRFEDNSCDIGIATSNGSSKGILKSKARIGRSFSESCVDFVDYFGSPSYSISSTDCIPEESSSLKKTVRFSNVIAKQTFRTNSSILGQKSKNQRKKRNKKRAHERRASEGDPDDAGSLEAISDENVFDADEFGDHNGNFSKERRDSGLADTDDGEQEKEETGEDGGKRDENTYKLPSYASKNNGKYQEIKFKNDLIFDLDM